MLQICTKMGKSIKEDILTTILSQALSPDGRYLLAGDIYGTLYVFDLYKISENESDKKDESIAKIKYRFQLFATAISGLVATKKWLIAATEGEIRAYDWSTLKSNSKVPRQLWTLSVPNAKQFDVNCLHLVDDDTLYIGSDNGFLHKYDFVSAGFVVTKQTDHESIYDLVYKDNMLGTCGEDGTVKLWDERIKNEIQKLDPIRRDANLDRPKFGRFLSSLDISTDSWLVCGGGPTLSLWHLKMLQNAVNYAEFGGAVFQARFHDDEVLAAGSFPYVHRYSLDGKLIAEIPCSQTTVYSLLYDFRPGRSLLTMAGSSHLIDFCTTLKYRDRVLSID